MNRPTINLQKLIDLTRIGCALFTVKKIILSWESNLGYNTTFNTCTSRKYCSPLFFRYLLACQCTVCKEHSNFINEDRKNFRLSELFRSHEKRVSRVFRTFKFVEQLETKNSRLEIVTRDT